VTANTTHDEALRDLEASVNGYIEAFPSADEESVRAFLAFVRSLQIYTAAGNNRQHDDLPASQFALMRLIFFTDEKAMAQSEIARSMGVTGTYVTRLIDALEAKGYVERVVNSSDRRVTNAVLTPAGEAKCQARLPGAIRTMEAYFNDFTTEEKRTMQHLLAKLSTSILAARAPEYDT
jgi:DNA-binding MarR family transcriptional regulator